MSASVDGNESTETSDGLNVQFDELQLFSSALSVPGEMMREVFSFCDVRAQFRLLLSSKQTSRCLRKFCKRFDYSNFVEIKMFDWRRFVDLFEAYEELEVYFEDGAYGLKALDAIKRSNLTHLNLSANFPIGAPLIQEFINGWVSLPDTTLRNLQSLAVTFGEDEDQFFKTLLRIIPTSITRLDAEFEFQDPSVLGALVNRFRNLRSLTLFLDFIERVSVETMADSVACVLDLPFLEEFVLDNDSSFEEAAYILQDRLSFLTHPFVKYYSDRGLTPRFDPLWTTFKCYVIMREPWNFLSLCIDQNWNPACDARRWLPRYVRMPRNNVGYSAILQQLDNAKCSKVLGWYRAIMSAGVDLQWERLETKGGDPEFRWINVVLQYVDTRILELLFIDKILPGPNKSKITMIEGLAQKLGYVPFCKDLKAHLVGKGQEYLSTWLWERREAISPLAYQALGIHRLTDDIQLPRD